MLAPPQCSRSVAAWQRWHKPVVVPSHPGWEGAWAAVRGTCPSSPALSCSVLQTHETLWLLRLARMRQGLPSRCGRTFSCSQHTSVQRSSRFCLFSPLPGCPSFWVSYFDPTAFPPPMIAGRQGAVGLNTSPGRSSLFLRAALAFICFLACSQALLT